MYVYCLKDAALYYVVSDGSPGFAVFDFNHSRMIEGNRPEKEKHESDSACGISFSSLESNSQLKVDHPIDTLFSSLKGAFSTAALLIPMKRIAGSHRKWCDRLVQRRWWS